jgi:beta-phosphoglucomutase
MEVRLAARMGSPRALIFDFNGTLSHDEPLLYEIYRELFARYGRPLTEERYFSELAGLSEEAITGGWLHVDGPLLASIISERIAAYADRADGTSVTEPVRAAVRHAATRLPVAIVSGAYRAEIEPVVAAAGLTAQFSTIVTADDVMHGKPDPEGYLLAVGRLGVAASDTVALEDTAAGIAAAKGAGVYCVGVRGTLPDSRLAGADELVSEIDVALVERLLDGG